MQGLRGLARVAALWLATSAGLPGAAAAQEEDFELPAGDATPADVEAAEPADRAPPAVPEPPPPAAPAPGPARDAPSAGADTVLVVVTANSPLMQEWAAELGPRATESLARRLDATPAGLAAALDPELEATRARAIEEACAEVRVGLEAFEMLDLEEARLVLRDAVEGLLAHQGNLDARARAALAQGLFGLATTRLFEGETQAADSTFVALAAIEPGFRPEPGRYPSNVLERFERLRGRIGAQGTQTLTVRTQVRGAEVFVDGGRRGVTPLEIPELAVGRHALAVQHPAYRPVGRLVELTAERPSTLDLELLPGPGAALLAEIAAADPLDEARAVALARRLDAARVALVRVVGTPGAQSADGAWVDARAGRVIGLIRGRALDPDLRSAAAQLAASLASSERAPAPAVAPARAQAEAPLDLAGAWWLWVAVGAVVVAGAVTAGFALSGGGDDGPPRNTAIFRF